MFEALVEEAKKSEMPANGVEQADAICPELGSAVRKARRIVGDCLIALPVLLIFALEVLQSNINLDLNKLLDQAVDRLAQEPSSIEETVPMPKPPKSPRGA